MRTAITFDADTHAAGVGPRGGARRRGIVEIDVVAGLVIVGALTMALAGVAGRQHRAAQKLADTRAAAQVAETVLSDLQAVGKPRAAPSDADVDVRVLPASVTSPARVPATAPDVPAAATGPVAEAHPGSWVEVVVTVRKGRASLVGPVPDALPGGGP